MTRLEIVAELRSWVGTPWRHQGRTKHKGCDCLGLVVELARLADRLPAHIPTNYHRMPFHNLLERTFDKYLDRVEGETRVLDVVLMTWRRNKVPAHAGVLVPWPPGREEEGPPFGLLHALFETGAVSEHQFLPERMNVVRYYRLKDF